MFRAFPAVKDANIERIVRRRQVVSSTLRKEMEDTWYLGGHELRFVVVLITMSLRSIKRLRKFASSWYLLGGQPSAILPSTVIVHSFTFQVCKIAGIVILLCGSDHSPSHCPVPAVSVTLRRYCVFAD